MKLTILLCTLCLITGFCFGRAGLGTELSRQQAIIYLETARNNHQYYVDHPEADAPWQVYPEQDADWVKRYDQIIEILR